MTLEEYFTINPELAIAFSGGTDSAYLLYEAKKYARRVDAYYVQTSFQIPNDFEDAKKFCHQYHIPLHLVQLDQLDHSSISKNDSNRCFHCKMAMFTALLDRIAQDHYTILADGTNASDNILDRPGSKALELLGIHWPLRTCLLTKDQIRTASSAIGLFTAYKPDNSCLATRIQTGQKLTLETLNSVAQCEGYLHQLGFRDFRVRVQNHTALIQVPDNQFTEILHHKNEIRITFLPYFSEIYLDLMPRIKSVLHPNHPETDHKKGPTKWESNQL